jgi:O-methyltransferase
MAYLPKTARAQTVFLRRPRSIFLFFILKEVTPYTSANWDILCQIQVLIDDIDRKDVPGDFVETGGWRGGCGIFMAWVSKKNGSERRTWVFDSFENEPDPPPENPLDFLSPLKEKLTLTTSDTSSPPPESPRHLAQKLEVLTQLVVAKGAPETSVPFFKKNIKEISLLFIHGTDYQLITYLLTNFFDRISKGGYIVLNDYSAEPTRKALYDFFCKKGYYPLIYSPDSRSGAFFQKL